MLADAARGVVGWDIVGIYTRRLPVLKDKFVCHFKLVADMVDSISEKGAGGISCGYVPVGQSLQS